MEESNQGIFKKFSILKILKSLHRPFKQKKNAKSRILTISSIISPFKFGLKQWSSNFDTTTTVVLKTFTGGT